MSNAHQSQRAIEQHQDQGAAGEGWLRRLQWRKNVFKGQAMNFYPFHIGDYATHTAHLKPMEDLALRRLLDLYYLRQGPLPADVQATARLIRMRAMLAKVEVVLGEFFILTEDGWIQKRCEAELAAMCSKQAAREDRQSHESDRMRRYRERRAMMFEALRVVGVVPAWDMPMKDLQVLFDARCGVPERVVMPEAPELPELPEVPAIPETQLQREEAVFAVAPATAIPTPTPTPTPIPIPIPKGKKEKSACAPPARVSRPDDVDEQVWADWMQLRKAKNASVTPTVIAEARRECAKAGLSLERFLAVWCARGSQGLQADWLKPNERGGGAPLGGRLLNRQEALEAANAEVVARYLERTRSHAGA